MTGKVYLITGAGHFPGIGSCLAEQLLEQDQYLVINSRSLDDKWTDLKNRYSDNVCFVLGDITDPAVQDKFISTAIDTWGKIDVLVNNASTMGTGPSPSREDWNQEFLLNVTVPYELAIKSAEYLKSTQGSVIMIGSRLGVQVVANQNSGNLAYSISKSAMHYLSTSLAVILSPGVKVNTVVPGFFPSARQKIKYSDDEIEKLKTKFSEKSLTKDVVSAKGLVDTVIFLVNNPNITGQTISVCNGATVHRIS